MDYKINIEELKNLSKTNNEDIQGIVLVHLPEMYGETRLSTISKIKTSNIDKKDYGLHFVFDDTKDTIYQLVDKKYKTEFLKGKATYISKALFSQEPNGKVIYIYIHINENNKYEATEEKLIRFLVTLLREFKLTAKDVWRGFDLDGNDYSPLHLLDKDIFEKYITEIEKFIPPVKSTLEGVNGNPDKFIEAISQGSIKAHKKYSILPSLTMAQAALESGWGKSAIGNNLFGIKAFDDWTGKKKKVWTTEYDANGNAYKIEAWFRDYDSVDESLEDHAKVLSTDRYAKVRAAKNYKEATQAVKDCGYATDPNYPSLLNNLIEQYNLNRYDDSSTFNFEEEIMPLEDIDDDKITIESPFKEAAKKAGKTIDQYINDIYKENKDDPKSYASKFSPWDKDRLDTKEDNPSGKIETMTTPFDNTIVYKISQSAPTNVCDCEKPADFIEAVETPEETLVEPIYPDLVVPPGGEIHIADGFSKTEVQSSSDTPLNAEEFEKRQKTFDFSQFSNIKKETTGRPANPEDPFPVDDQIKKLEEHYPKVKIDKTTFNFKDDNHMNSEIGNAMIKNLAMTYDMVNEVAKRTEQRLVKIENNLSTVMRNLFRMSSRVNINCVYYGGQSVYGKYKCIRCLDDHRVNDGAIVTIDQCLNCTRYEPVLGQVYAILDETGSNIVQVMDDMQMAYLGIKDYTDLNSISGYYEGQTNAKVDTIPAETPKPFIEDKWKDEEKEEESDSNSEDSKEITENSSEEKEEVKVNGFKMDWNPVALETQQPNINEYDTEGLKAEKKAISSDRQEIDRTIFKDTREQAIEYDTFEFDIKDYQFSNFGDSSSSSSSSDGAFGMGATEVRQKIVDYALKAVEMCNDGIAFYSQGNRYNHMENAINGKHYWDCSSLVQRAYEAAGISGIGTYTANQYPHCLDSAGGLLIPIKNVDQALPGDMVWFKAPPQPATKEELQKVNYGDTSVIHHIGIYIGDNKYAHASNPDTFPNIKVSTLGYYSHEMCFGRVKALIDLDKAASQGGTGSGAWDKAAQGITDDLWNASKVADSNVSGMIDNMNKYGYKEVLKEAAKAKGYDPYFIAAIIAIETTGNPLAGGNYPGIMQCSSGYATTTVSGIKDNILKGCDALTVKANWLKSKGWTENNMPLLATAHNCGQYGTTDALGHTHETYPNVAIPMMGKVYDLNKITVQEASSVIADYTSTYQKYWNVEEKRTYACKVLRAYNSLINQKALS